MTQFFYFFIIMALFTLGCSKPDPHPELRDPIYIDLQAKEKELATSIESEKKNLDEASAKMSAASPQTGQIKYARKHYFETKKRLEKIQQLHRYYKLRIESRAIEAQDAYLDAYDKKQPESWPNKDEFEEYRARESARMKSRNWSVKERIEIEKAAAAPINKPAGGGH